MKKDWNNLWNVFYIQKDLPWFLAELSDAIDWTPCPSSCGWTAIKSRTLTTDIGSTDNATTRNGSADGTANGSSNGSSNGSPIGSSNGSANTQFAFCKLNPCYGKWQLLKLL